jgi:hypothetical protein
LEVVREIMPKNNTGYILLLGKKGWQQRFIEGINDREECDR